MAIALTPFRGFCGFLPLPQMLLLLSTIPEMRSLIGEEPLEKLAASLSLPLPASSGKEGEVDEELSKLAEKSTGGGKVEETTPEQKKALRGVFEVLMRSSEESVKSTLQSLLSRYSSSSTKCATQAEERLVELVKQLNSQFPDDVGVLCCFILNVVELEVGKSVFLKADEPHAYISGGEYGVEFVQGTRIDESCLVRDSVDIIECMATSGKPLPSLITGSLPAPTDPYPSSFAPHRQRRPSRSHPQTQGRRHPHLHAHLRLGPRRRSTPHYHVVRAKDRIARPSHRGILRAPDLSGKQGGTGETQGGGRTEHLDRYRGKWERRG